MLKPSQERLSRWRESLRNSTRNSGKSASPVKKKSTHPLQPKPNTNISRTNRGEIEPGQAQATEHTMDKALSFFRNAASILSSKK